MVRPCALARIAWLTIQSSDYNYVRDGDECVPVGPEPIPAGVCKTPDQKYMGSSGYRKIPGNTCIGGTKDEEKEKPCSQGTFSGFASRLHMS
jgi:hypothetical protein